MRKVNLQLVKPSDITDAPKLVVPMPEPIEVPDSLVKAMGQPEKMWVYRLGDGGAYGAVARWDPPAGADGVKPRKQVRPIVWDGQKFVTSGFGQNRPLFNSDLLAARPMAPVLVVEGEKAVDGAYQYVPDGWVVTTWQGGSNAWEYTDWTALAGHRVVLWPDNDGPGVSAMAEIQAVLSAIAVPSSLVQISAAFPDGWDLADALPEKYTEKQITALLKKELKAAEVVALDITEEPETVLTEAENEDPDEDPARRYRPLGYNHGEYYLMTDNEYQINAYSSQTLMSEKGLMAIHADREFWAAQQFSEGKRIDWIGAGVNVMNECRAKGVYDPRNLRGRGVWMDKDKDGTERAILHTGDKLYVSRPEQELKEVSFVRVKSPAIYQARPRLITDAEYGLIASDEEGRLIREMCQQIRWSSPLYAELLAGWMATAMICGGMDWRTHCWVTGNHGSGKSTVIRMVVEACMGPMALYPVGNTTEAGIRNALKSDAIPVVFDESETDKYAEERRQQVLALMRQASSEGRGTIIKGSATHTAHEFNIRSAFMLVSIGVGLKQGADLTRTAVLSIRPASSYAASERQRLEDMWNRMQDIAAILPRDLPQKLIARQTKNLFTIRHNIGIFKQTISDLIGSPRIGDQLGTLLAGAHSLYSSQRLTKKQCEKYLAKQNLDDFTEVKEEREDTALLRHMCGSMIRVETLHGVQDRTIGELLRQVFLAQEGDDVSYRVCVATLARYGLKVEIEAGERTGVWIANQCPLLDKLMQTAEFAEGWITILRRHPYSKASRAAVRFGALVSKSTFLPRQEWPVETS